MERSLTPAGRPDPLTAASEQRPAAPGVGSVDSRHLEGVVPHTMGPSADAVAEGRRGAQAAAAAVRAAASALTGEGRKQQLLIKSREKAKAEADLSAVQEKRKDAIDKLTLFVGLRPLSTICARRSRRWGGRARRRQPRWMRAAPCSTWETTRLGRSPAVRRALTDTDESARQWAKQTDQYLDALAQGANGLDPNQRAWARDAAIAHRRQADQWRSWAAAQRTTLDGAEMYLTKGSFRDRYTKGVEDALTRVRTKLVG